MPQYDIPRYVKYIGGYGYGLNGSKEYNLELVNGIKLGKQETFYIDNYPFVEYESALTFFFPSKKQIFRKIEICGNDKLKIINSSLKLIYPSIYDRYSGGFESPELVDVKNVSQTLNLFVRGGNCFSYHSPSNSEGREVDGYNIYLIKVSFKPDTYIIDSFKTIFFVIILILIVVTLILHFLLYKYKFNYKDKLILIPLSISLTGAGWLINQWSSLWLAFKKELSINLSLGDVIIFMCIFILIFMGIGITFILLHFNKNRKKKANDIKCLPLCIRKEL
jgi:hypothetical protein